MHQMGYLKVTNTWHSLSNMKRTERYCLKGTESLIDQRTILFGKSYVRTAAAAKLQGKSKRRQMKRLHRQPDRRAQLLRAAKPQVEKQGRQIARLDQQIPDAQVIACPSTSFVHLQNIPCGPLIFEDLTDWHLTSSGQNDNRSKT